MSLTIAPIKAVLTLLLLLAMPLTIAQGQSGAREAMADAMAQMMEAMGMFNPSSGTSAPPYPMWMPGAGGAGMPWGGSPFQDPSGAMSMGDNMMRKLYPNMPGVGSPGQSYPWMGAGLEGIWEGRDGELLIVQGKRFRIYSGAAAYVDGYLHTQGDKLAMYNTGDQQARAFEYAESDGRLVLRDPAGQIYLYRRLRLDAVEPGEAPSAPAR
jgi:hypothetical protein